MNKIYFTFLFLCLAFTSNAQQYPSIESLKTDFNKVQDHIQADIKFISSNIEDPLNDEQIKTLEAVFYNKFKHIAGSENLNNYEAVTISTSERILGVLGSKNYEKLAEKQNAILILSGRIYLNESALNNN